MAVSDAMRYRMNTGGSAEDLYATIRDFLAASPDAATTQAQMAQYGISGEDVANATGGASGGLLSGNILAGASWNSLNPTLAGQLTEATGQATSNYAVGGATTADTLAQLNTYLAGGGQFDPNATVFLQTGGVDFLQGVDKGTIKDNINQIVKTLGAQGVDVVLTGSPYAASVDDVVNNNFDPKVDQIFTDIANENKNVALVGTQGEILQNKALLVDALHTNAEGTSIYNQSVIDSLSQFKNEVPSNTPQDIAQVQKTNTVVAPPPIITQAASSPAVAQALAVQAPNIQELIASGALQPNQATLIGDTYYQPIYTQIGSGEDAQLGPLENVITYKANENQVGGNVNYYSPTGEYEQTTKQKEVAGSFLGGLAEAFNDPVVQAAFLGLGGGGALGNLLGLTGSTAQAVGTGLFKGGAAAAGGASLEDALKTGLLSGGLVYGGNELANVIKNLDVPVDFTNMTQDQINDALDVNFRNDLARAGLSDAQIKSFLANPASIYDATQAVTEAVTQPVAVSTPVTDAGAVTVTAPTTTPTLSNVLNTIASTTPAVTITAPKTTGMTTQEVINLVESQMAANLGTPANVGAPTNLANVQVTGDRLATTQEIANAVFASVPNITTQQAQTIAEQVIASGKPVTNQEIVNAVAATIPAVAPTTTPTTTPTTLATQTITAPKPATVEEIVNAITATIPTVTPAQAQTVAEQVITSDRPVTTQEVINAITATIPLAPEPRLTITADRPSSITDIVTAATIPLIQPSTPLTAPAVTAQTTTDPLRVAQLALTTAGLLGAGTALSGGTTQYPIVPIPDTFLTPATPAVAPYAKLPAIDFGDSNLLRGTQWEKFLSPNYGKVPLPVQYSQPSKLSYNDLMGILGSRQGMPAKSSLSINDIISGIQNQYGQTPVSTMG
jgi:hypothetical protein